LGEFLFSVIFPRQPPNIFPISFNLFDIWIYFLSFNDFVSQRICNNKFNVSNFLIEKFNQAIFSFFCKKVAIAIPSIISINKLSIFNARVYR